MTPEEAEAIGRDILARQPFSTALGVELVALEVGACELRLPLAERHTQHLGMAHGGVIASLADMALAFAGGLLMGEGSVTQEFKINFLRPGKGEALVARSEVIGSGRNQAVVRADVLSVDKGAEKLCATAQGTIMRAAR
jgi:uncharacterized protein (TIGR00369 family)